MLMWGQPPRLSRQAKRGGFLVEASELRHYQQRRKEA
jgi:hypothetical protein